MALTFYPIAMAVLSVVTLLAGIWLSLHLASVSHLFAGKADVVESRKRPIASRSMTIAMLAIFNIGWIACIVLWIALI